MDINDALAEVRMLRTFMDKYPSGPKRDKIILSLETVLAEIGRLRELEAGGSQ